MNMSMDDDADDNRAGDDDGVERIGKSAKSYQSVASSVPRRMRDGTLDASSIVSTVGGRVLKWGSPAAFPLRDARLGVQEPKGSPSEGPDTTPVVSTGEMEPSNPTAGQATKKRTRASRKIGEIGDMLLYEVPDGEVTGLSRFDTIVLPVDGKGGFGSFITQIRDLDPELVARATDVLAQKRGSGIILSKGSVLDDSMKPLLIDAVEPSGSSLKSRAADFHSAAHEALLAAGRGGAKQILFPISPFGEGPEWSDATASAFVGAVQSFARQQADNAAGPIRVHVATADMAILAKIRKLVQQIARNRSTRASSPPDTKIAPSVPTIARQTLPVGTTGYRTDSLAAEPSDFVGVGAEILAFARLAASREIEPPLAVGVFGDWGSGKSFFMNGVRRKIDKLGEAEKARIKAAKDAGEEDPVPEIHDNVVQIEFNAWHYIEKNLWASLVEYIFSRLEEWLREHNEDQADNGSALFESLATSRQLKLDTARSVMSANAELNAARKAAAEAEERRATALKSKSVALGALFKATVTELTQGEAGKDIRKKLDKLGFAKTQNNVEDLESAIAQLNQTGDRTSLLWQAVRAQVASPWAWVAVLSLFVLPVVLQFVVNWALAKIGSGIQISTFLAGASAALMTATAWIKRFLGQVKPALDSVEHFTARVRDKMASLEEGATKAEKDALVDAQTKAAEAEKQVSAAQERLKLAAAQAADAQNRYTAESARGRLNRFIRERLADGTYGKHLGLIATIRKDFEQLTALVTPSTQNKAEEERNKQEETAYRLRVEALLSEASPPGEEDLLGEEARQMLAEAMTPQKPPCVFERIVLYIDDLDRCPPDRVVEVLQAVHMLLSFRLFVVFVAVDARWVTCALREVYEHQLEKGHMPNPADLVPAVAQSSVADMATAEDYMEKIFQIPYWVQPLQGSAAGGFMRKLVTSFGVAETVADMDSGQEVPSSAAATGPQSTNDGQPGMTAVINSSDGPAESPAHEDEDQESADDGEADEAIVAFARAAKLELVKADLEALAALAPVVGTSPRRVKRFFNTYLLIQSIASVTVNEPSEEIEPAVRAHMKAMLDGCSFAQQTLALAVSLALAMQADKVAGLDIAMIANVTELQTKKQAIGGLKLPASVAWVLKAYCDARKVEDAFPDGYQTAFSLFLPIAYRYGFHEGADVAR